MSWTKDETISQLNAIAQKIDSFYKKCPYRKGNLKREKVPSDEFVAEYIINNLVIQKDKQHLIKGINLDTRDNYFDKPRKEIDKKKGSKEEIFQRYIYFGKELDGDLSERFAGEDFIWFEFSGYPRIGKGIDLISYNRDQRTITLYELKFGDVNEHLLKAILEVQTYYQRTRFDKLKKDWKKYNSNCSKPESHYESLDLLFENDSIRKVLLLDRRTLAYKQFVDENNKNMLKLIKMFDIEVISFDGSNYQI